MDQLVYTQEYQVCIGPLELRHVQLDRLVIRGVQIHGKLPA